MTSGVIYIIPFYIAPMTCELAASEFAANRDFQRRSMEHHAFPFDPLSWIVAGRCARKKPAPAVRIHLAQRANVIDRYWELRHATDLVLAKTSATPSATLYPQAEATPDLRRP